MLTEARVIIPGGQPLLGLQLIATLRSGVTATAFVIPEHINQSAIGRFPSVR